MICGKNGKPLNGSIQPRKGLHQIYALNASQWDELGVLGAREGARGPEAQVDGTGRWEEGGEVATGVDLDLRPP